LRRRPLQSGANLKANSADDTRNFEQIELTLNPQPISKTSYRVLTLVEALSLACLIAAYIWRFQSASVNSWLVFPVWLAGSILLHRDTPKTLGWRADNLWPASRQGWKIFIGFVIAAWLAGLGFGALHRLPPHLTELRRALAYGAFCLLQQIALNSYLTNRLLYAIEDVRPVAVLAGAIFAALHWPNPVLVPLTFIGGAAMSWLFARERNILPLAAGQAVVGTLVWWALPAAWHHGMRVGPGYYSFHP
jgi:CAAX prenyl protease-like protein